MDAVHCNTPTTTGYSVALSGYADVLRLYSHSTGTTVDWYEELEGNPSVAWMYMPVDQGEFLTEMWIIKSPNAGFTAFIVSFNCL